MFMNPIKMMCLPKCWICVLSLLLGAFALGSASAQERAVVASATPDTNYRLSPNDQLAISVYEEPDLTVERSVASNGMITLPLIDQVKVAGKTVSEAQNTIAAAYREQQFLRFPQVSVTVAQFAERTVSVFGEVNKPGAVVIPGGQTRIELLSAIALAGDFKRIAKKSKVKVTRNQGRQGQKTEEIDVKDLLESKGTRGTIYLYPGDIVSVPQRIF